MGLFRKNKSEAPRPLTSLTAGGTTYRAASYTDATQVAQLRQVWQQKVFDIYDTEGHLFYATNYIGGAMSRIRLIAAKRPKEDGDLQRPEVITSGPVANLVRNISAAKGGQSGFLRQVGRNIFLVGEVWVVASNVTYPDGKIHQQWDAVSVDEIMTASGNSTEFMRRALPGAQPQKLPAGTSTFRLWKEHPRFSELADAGSRSCLELLEKIIVLNRAEKAVARSQMAGSGILALPQDLVPPAWQNQDSNPNPMMSNPLYEALAEAMTAPLRDENAPSSVLPFVLIGPGDSIGKIKYEPMARKFDSNAAQASINGAINQIANTLELPKEILLGVGEATHFTAWAIREDVFQAHIQPLIELVCESLTRTFLRMGFNKLSATDQAAVLKSLDVESVDDIMVWYDASQLVIAPDRQDKYIAAHDRFVITDDALATAIGIPEEDRLDKSSDEYAQRVGLKMADPGMAVTGKPTPPPAPAAPAAGGGKTGPKQ